MKKIDYTMPTLIRVSLSFVNLLELILYNHFPEEKEYLKCSRKGKKRFIDKIVKPAPQN